MSRTNKFGYGFLWAGVGMPYLIDKWLGTDAAVVVSIACVVVGIAFLIAGHRHGKSWSETGVLITIVGVIGAGASMVYLIYAATPKVEPAQLTCERGQSYEIAVASGDHDTYSIGIIFRIKNHAYSTEDFGINVAQSSLRRLEQQTSNTDVQFGDMAGVVGSRDAHDNPFFLFLIYHLVPHERREITFQMLDKNNTRPSGGELPPAIQVQSSERTTVSAEVFSYTETQRPIKKNNDVLLIPYQVNERLLIENAVTCFKRNETIPACEVKRFQEGPTSMVPGKHYLGLTAVKAFLNVGIAVNDAGDEEARTQHLAQEPAADEHKSPE